MNIVSTMWMINTFVSNVEKQNKKQTICLEFQILIVWFRKCRGIFIWHFYAV